MSTLLIPICNHSLSFDKTEETARYVLKGLRDYDWGKDHFAKVNGRIYPERADWKYDIKRQEDEPLSISFQSEFSSYFPTIYAQCAEITTSYRLSLIYQNYSLGWFRDFRVDLFKIVSLIGGEEVIYLADHNNKLAGYLGQVWDGISYTQIKNDIIRDFGNPVTDFSKLDYNNLDYSNLKEFFLDDFYDLKSIDT